MGYSDTLKTFYIHRLCKNVNSKGVLRQSKNNFSLLFFNYFSVTKNCILISVMQTIPPSLDQSDNKQHNDPSVVYFNRKLLQLLSWNMKQNVICGYFCNESTHCFFDGKKKLHLPKNKTAKDRARNTCTCISPC